MFKVESRTVAWKSSEGGVGGLHVCADSWYYKIDKNSTDLYSSVSHISLAEALELCLGGLSSTKLPRGDRVEAI